MYINLLNVRFENSISLEINIDKELLECDVLKFMLQPIVENSVYHGIIPTKRSGTIRVSAECDRKNLYVYVDDDGAGMSDEILDKINSELKKGPDELDNSIMKVMYGNEYVDTTLQEVKNSWWLNRKKSDIGVGVKNTNNRIKLIFGDEYNVSVYKLEDSGTRVVIK